MNTISLWPGDTHHTILITPPEGRYAIGKERGARLGTRDKPRQWESVGPAEWRCRDSVMDFSASLGPVANAGGDAQRTLHISVRAHTDARVERCAVVFEAPCTAPPLYVDRSYQWRSLRGTSALSDFGQLMVRWTPGGRTSTELRLTRGMTSCVLSWANERLRLSVLIDAGALHPRWRFVPGGRISAAAPVWERGKTLGLGLLLTLVDSNRGPGAIAARFPQGAEAGLVLTDHCDFDDTERLRIFLQGDGRDNGWIGRGLRLTKGVFASPVAFTDRAGVPTLHDGRYRELIRALHADGSEIAPHAITESGDIPAPVFKEALSSMAAEWSPHAWIDHGNTIGYCYTMGGADDPEYDLLGTLRNNGFTLLWSYHDVPRHGSATLNLLSDRSSDVSAMLRALIRHLAKGELLIALHYVRSFMERHTPGAMNRVTMRMLSAIRIATSSLGEHRRLVKADLHRAVKRAWGNPARGSDPLVGVPSEPYSREELLGSAAVIYPERAVPMYNTNPSDIWLFSTMEDVHARDILTREALDGLLIERGLHVGHCYLLNNLRYIAGLFEGTGGNIRLTKEWSEFVHYLSDMVRSGRIWNPCVSRLAGWMLELHSVSIVPWGDREVRLANPLPWFVRDYTLLLPSTTPPGSVHWLGESPKGWRANGEWLAVWGDIPPSHEGIINWGITSDREARLRE